MHLFYGNELFILGAATRLKGGAGWAAIFIFTNLPVILANLILEVAPQYYLYIMYPAYSINMLWFPSMWFFTQSQLDKSFRLTRRRLLHAIPALVSLVAYIVYYAPLTEAQVEAEIIMMKAGGKNLPAKLNDCGLYLGLIVYLPSIIFYARKRMKYLRDHFSDSDYIKAGWMPRVLVWYVCGIIIVAAAYAIYPLSAVFTIPASNMVGMAVLTYSVIFHSTTAYINRLPDKKEVEAPAIPEVAESSHPSKGLGEVKMKEICDKVTSYLITTRAYTDPDLSLSKLSTNTRISARYISSAINGRYKKNFFDFINEMRIDDAKNRLRALDVYHTIDSVAGKCGFRSRSAFFATFKKVEGMTPSQWIRKNIDDSPPKNQI